MAAARQGAGPPGPPPRLGGALGLDAVAQFLTEAQELGRLRAADAAQRFYAVHVPEAGPTTCTELASAEELAAFVQARLGVPGQVLMFRGARWHLTRGPLKFLVPPPGQGERIPLFQGGDDLDVDPDGSTALDGGPEDSLPPGRPAGGLVTPPP